MPSAQQLYDSARESSVSGGDGLRFPLDLGPTAMVMSFQKYGYSGTFGRASKISRGSIVLPIPQQIVDQYGINIGARDLGASGAGLVDLGTQGALNTVQGALNTAEDMGRDIATGIFGGNIESQISSSAQKARYFTRSAIDGLAPGVGMALDVVNGTTVNPHTTLAFDGVNLKEFEFSWQLAPKNAAESQALVNIRNKIRSSILPDVEGLGGSESGGSLSRAFLTYPDLVHIYFTGLVEQDYIWFKPAMIKNFNINFSPQGNVILQGGKPGFVQMSMTVQEAQIHTRGDYTTAITAGGLYDEAGFSVSDAAATASAVQNAAIEAEATAQASAADIEGRLSDLGRGIVRGF